MPVRYLMCILFAFIFGYHQGAEKVKRDMAIQAAVQAEDARQKERNMQARLNGITENYLHEIDEYKKTINAYAANDLDVNGITENYLHEIDEYKKTINAYAANDLDVNRLSDARPCKAVPGDTADRPGAVCYTERLKKVWILPRNATN